MTARRRMVMRHGGGTGSMFMALASLGCFRPGRNRMRCDEKAPPAGWREGRESGGAAPGTT
ncbi:MAG: hypothetical protein DBY37_05915 [Desulfovibrionaceae bacterium]|nr:MAG: hypothetical protein DBY37_05915 [Desulfovibrionaceae bacterium]